MTLWQTGDVVGPTNLNARGGSVTTSGGFSTNTLLPESGSTITIAGAAVLRSVDSGGAVRNVLAFGAVPSLAVDSTAAIQAAINAGKGVVYFPPGTYAISSITVPRNRILRGSDARDLNGAAATQLYQGSANTTAVQLIDTGGSGVVIEDIVISASGNANNLGGVLIAGMGACELHRVGVSSTSAFGVQIVGGNNGNANALHECVITNLDSLATCIDIQGQATGMDSSPNMVSCYVNSNSPWISIVSAGLRPDAPTFVANRFISASSVTAIYAEATNARFIGNRFETVVGNMQVTLSPQAGIQPVAQFIANSYAAPGGLVWTDSSSTPSPRWQENVRGITLYNAVQDGVQRNPAYTFASDLSLGLYKSGVSTLALSYGTLLLPGQNFVRMPTGGAADGRLITRTSNSVALTVNLMTPTSQDTTGAATWGLEFNASAGTNDAAKLLHARPGGGIGIVYSWDSLGNSSCTDGTALLPAKNFNSENSLGWYRSGASTMALSYGTLNLRGGALSLRTTTSSASASNLTNGEICLVAVSTTSAQLAFKSGNTVYVFNAVQASP